MNLDCTRVHLPNKLLPMRVDKSSEHLWFCLRPRNNFWHIFGHFEDQISPQYWKSFNCGGFQVRVCMISSYRHAFRIVYSNQPPSLKPSWRLEQWQRLEALMKQVLSNPYEAPSHLLQLWRVTFPTFTVISIKYTSSFHFCAYHSVFSFGHSCFFLKYPVCLA